MSCCAAESGGLWENWVAAAAAGADSPSGSTCNPLQLNEICFSKFIFTILRFVVLKLEELSLLHKQKNFYSKITIVLEFIRKNQQNYKKSIQVCEQQKIHFQSNFSENILILKPIHEVFICTINYILTHKPRLSFCMLSTGQLPVKEKQESFIHMRKWGKVKEMEAV